MNNAQSLGKFGTFKLLKELSSSGNSKVFLAEEDGRDEPVAIQIFSDLEGTTEEDEEYFLQQARQSQNISHKYLVKILDVQDGPNQPYIVMEYHNGRTLREVIDKNELDVKSACKVIGKVASAVTALHLAGIAHLNIHPENILIDSKGNPSLVGYGTAPKKFSETTSGPPQLAYLPPERITQTQSKLVKTHKDKFKCDIYSLGVVLFETITGEVPFHFKNFEELSLAIFSGYQILPSGIISWPDSALDAICRKAMKVNMEDRYESMRSFSKDLKAYLKDEPTLAQTMENSYVMLKAVIGGVAALVLLVLGILFFNNKEPAEVEKSAIAAVTVNENDVQEQPAEAPEEEPSIDSIISEELLSWSQKQFQTALNNPEMGHIDWQAKLSELPDTEEAVRTLVRCLNAIASSSDAGGEFIYNENYVGSRQPVFRSGRGGFGETNGGLFESSMGNQPITSTLILELIQKNSTPLAPTTLQAIALSETLDTVDISENLSLNVRRDTAKLLIDKSENLSSETRCLIAIKHHLGKPIELLAEIPTKENPEDEVSILKSLMEAVFTSSKNPDYFSGDYDSFSARRHGGMTGNQNPREEIQLAIINRLNQLDDDSANGYLFELLKEENPPKDKNVLLPSSRTTILKRFIARDDQPKIVKKLVQVIADEKFLTETTSRNPYEETNHILNLTPKFGPMLRKEFVEQHWNRNQIPNDRLKLIIPFDEAKSLPAMQALYGQNGVNEHTRELLERSFANFAAKSAGIALGWITPDKQKSQAPQQSQPRRDDLSAYRALEVDSSFEYENSQTVSVKITLAEQPFIREWLNEEEFLNSISQRLKIDEDQRTVLLEILASSLHPVAREVIDREIERYAEIGPRKFAGQSIHFASILSQSNPSMNESYGELPEELLSGIEYELEMQDQEYGSHHYGYVSQMTWGDPWMIVALKSPKRIRFQRPKSIPKRDKEGDELYSEGYSSRRNPLRGRLSTRNRPVETKPQIKSLTPREIQKAWFLAVRDCVEAWHIRCESAISRMPPARFQDAEVSKMFSLKLPKDTTILRQATWDSEVDQRGIQPLPDGHRIGFIEFESKIHPKRFQEMFEELVPSELGHGDDEWTDSLSTTDGIERNIDILYSEKDGLTTGSVLILERPVTEK